MMSSFEQQHVRALYQGMGDQEDEGVNCLSLEEEVSMLFRGGKVGLAPMVRAGTLPLRMLALQYGADTVWTEELIDKKLMECKRVENASIGTVDFLKGDQCVLRTTTCERHRVIVQLGTGDPESAVAAARVVAGDVAGIDVNMGCPKKFSLQGGMGAALLDEPGRAASIIRALRQALTIPVSCKVRLLESTDKTIDFIRRMEAAGACAISIHMRTRQDKSQEPAKWEALAPLVQAVSVPVLANGDLYTREDIARIRELSGCEGVMLARPALYNASVFKKEGPVEALETVIRAYLQSCLRWDNHIHNTKYTIMEMMNKRRHPDHLKPQLPVRLPPGKTLQLVSSCKTMEALLKAWDMGGVWDQHQHQIRLRRQQQGTGDQAITPATLEHTQRYDDDYFLKDGQQEGGDDEAPRQGVKRKQQQEQQL